MDDTTTPPADGGDNQQPQDNWEGRYSGLQKVLAKRDTELATANASLGSLQEERDAALAELATYRQREVDASEEETARQQYEALRDRFEPAPPKPIGNNPSADWLSSAGAPNPYQTRERSGTGSGWPIG